MAKINGKKVLSVVKTQAVAVNIEANPSGTPTETLTKLKIDNTIYGVDAGGTEVEANPAGAATDTLTKLKVGNTVYGVETPHLYLHHIILKPSYAGFYAYEILLTIPSSSNTQMTPTNVATYLQQLIDSGNYQEHLATGIYYEGGVSTGTKLNIYSIQFNLNGSDSCFYIRTNGGGFNIIVNNVAANESRDNIIQVF